MKLHEAELILEHIGELQEVAAKVATQLVELETGRRYDFDEEEISFECGNIYANWSEYCGCGEYEDQQTRIPLEYLFDKDWQEKAKVEIERKRKLKAEQERIRVEREKKAAEERERNQYLRLKAKFEGE